MTRPRPFRLATPGWCVPVLLFLAVFFVAPLAINLLRTRPLDQSAGTGAFFYYVKLFTDPYYAGVMWETLKVALITTVASLVIGYPVAFFMVRFAGRWNALIVFFVIAPLLTSIIMRTFGWRVLLARRGLLNTWLLDLGLITRAENIADDPIAVYIGLVHVLVPFMVLSIAAVLQGVDVQLEESARVLGAGRLRTFLHVTLPLSLDGIVTGCILVFVITNGSFLTMLLLGGNKITTLSLLIYQQFNTTQDLGFAAAMGNILMLIAVIGFALQYHVLRRRGANA
jgi:putative spermidine/putrescine transport system permease protein